MAVNVRLPSIDPVWRRRLLLTIPPLFGALIVYNMTTVYVEPGEFAVRQVYLGPSQGIQPDILGPGLHAVLPGYERLHTLSRTLHLLEFNNNQLQASTDASYAPSINIQTSEGYQVVVDVSVAYRIVDPYKVVTTIGPGDLYETALVRPRSDQVLRQKLGELNAEQFYLGPLRRQKAYEARELLEKELAPSGVQVWSVMVREYKYDGRYQEAIEQRKIQDQTVFKNRAEALAAAEEAEKDRVTAEGQARIAVETQRGASEVNKINSEADLYARKRIAEGDLLVEIAKAEAQKMENDALSAAGASNIVGLKMADALGNVQMIVVPTDGPGAVNPLNLESLTKGW